MKIGIINSGGDAQGINAVIGAACVYGISLGHEFIGFIKGWEGLLDLNYIQLDRKKVSGIAHLGGTILTTVNKGRFAGKAGMGQSNKIPDEILNLAKSNLEKLEIDALIVIGGDGTLSGAMQLAQKGVKIVGVPKTIDNDLNATDSTFGFSTAVDTVVDALDKIHTTAVSHERVFFVETMGRNSGWIALHSGLAGGASAVLLPEFEFSYESLINFLRKRKQTGRNFSIVVVAEGAKPKNAQVSTIGKVTDRPEIRLGGISQQIIETIEQLAPAEFEMRNVVLGHVQRGGAPNATDRILSKNVGIGAIDAILNKKFGEMVCLKSNEIITVPILQAISQIKVVKKDNKELQTLKKIGVFLGEV